MGLLLQVWERWTVALSVALGMNHDPQTDWRGVWPFKNQWILAQKPRPSLPVETPAFERGPNRQRQLLVVHEQMAIRRPHRQLDPTKFLDVNGIHARRIRCDLGRFDRLVRFRHRFAPPRCHRDVPAPDPIATPGVVEYIPTDGVDAIGERGGVYVEKADCAIAVREAWKQICYVAAILIVRRMPHRHSIQDYGDRGA